METKSKWIWGLVVVVILVVVGVYALNGSFTNLAQGNLIKISSTATKPLNTSWTKIFQVKASEAERVNVTYGSINRIKVIAEKGADIRLVYERNGDITVQSFECDYYNVSDNTDEGGNDKTFTCYSPYHLVAVRNTDAIPYAYEYYYIEEGSTKITKFIEMGGDQVLATFSNEGTATVYYR